MGRDHASHDVKVIPVWTDPAVAEHAAAIRIGRAATLDHLLFAEPFKRGGSAVPPLTSRVGTTETDAAMLFWRAEMDGFVSRVAMVDGSWMRMSGHRRVRVQLPDQ